MTTCFFVSDMHGHIDRYKKLFSEIRSHRPDILFIGGDVLPGGEIYRKKLKKYYYNFVMDFLVPEMEKLKKELRTEYPEVYIIMGNDDSRVNEKYFIAADEMGVWKYINEKKVCYQNYTIFGYSYIPPTPFMLKDWEKYDISRFVDVGTVSPEQGVRSVNKDIREIQYETIQRDLKELAKEQDLSSAIFLLHAPPYRSAHDRAALDGMKVDHAPLDVHVGSIAIQQFIKEKQPYITLHGHIHESSRITGKWYENIGRTHTLSAAYHGKELALIIFDLEDPFRAKRLIL
ncbi:MAG TPA: hypothetical protein ENG70_04105 [Candidatus Cloacimonetes bacterium]|nr:hypothetical protein [Candidatus Cloacimonadota bacterium]HEX38026.1 hypothetical protein [Candidatus Cloacimonadota bacterium]